MTEKRIREEFVNLVNRVGIVEAIKSIKSQYLVRPLICDEIKAGKIKSAIARKFSRTQQAISKVDKQMKEQETN